MSKMKWYMPVGQTNIIVLLFILSTFGALIIVYFTSDNENLFFLLFLLVPVFLMLGGFYLDRVKFRSVWHSPKLFIKRPIHLVLPYIFKALTDEGIPFTLVTTDSGGRVSYFNIQWDQVLKLDYGALRLHLLGKEGETLLFLGPVKKGNEEEVARVKDLIERAARVA